MLNEEGRSIHVKHIIIVGEPSDTLKSLSTLLEHHGYEVSIATEDSEELKHIISANPEASLLSPLHTAAIQGLLSVPKARKTRRIGITTPNIKRYVGWGL